MGRYETTAAEVGSPLGTLSGWRLGLCLGVLALTVIAIAAIDLQGNSKPNVSEARETATLALQFADNTQANQVNTLADQFNLEISSADSATGHYVVRGQLDQPMLAAFLALPGLLNIDALANETVLGESKLAPSANTRQSSVPAQ